MPARELDARAFYERANYLIASRTGNELPISFQCQCSPSFLSDAEKEACERRLSIINNFFEICLELFKETVHGHTTLEIYRFLLNDTLAGLRRKFHQRIPPALYQPPTFYRTDETPSGKIMEIQCPGSGWGDLQLLRDIYRTFSDDVRLNGYMPSSYIAAEIVQFVGKKSPAVLHLLDNASHPTSMQYLIRTAHPPLRYWGVHDGVKNADCDFVWSHSFFGLVAENLFKVRLDDAARGKIRFDQPPIVLFDQKAPLALPFWDKTRQLFPDEIREVFVYTYPIDHDGFRDENGEWVTIEEFKKRPKHLRRYFLKYAGSDVSLNWGSRGVYRLSDNGFKKTIDSLISKKSKFARWVIQLDVSESGAVSFFERDNNQVKSATLNAKSSLFVGNKKIIGIKTMHRDAPKVHGQEDTIVGIRAL